jgi:hypothetical protein
MPTGELSRREIERLEEHRIAYEDKHGQTEIKWYTSMMSVVQQDEMMIERPEDYVRGLPPYVQDYFRKMVLKRHILKKDLDEAPSYTIRAYLAVANTNKRGRE